MIADTITIAIRIPISYSDRLILTDRITLVMPIAIGNDPDNDSDADTDSDTIAITIAIADNDRRSAVLVDNA
ncbi:hypothetical protein Tco_0743338 [Tanacetum coccineum]